MGPTERERTTEYAVNRIDADLHRDYDYISALLLAAIYVDIRLRSLLTDRLSPEKERWRKVHAQLGDLLGVNRRIGLCMNLGLVSAKDAGNLKELWKVRSEVAHESRIWREPTNQDVEKIKRLCNCAIQFLQTTKAISRNAE